MTTKTMVLTGALGLALVNAASAVNYVYITGSTAARNSTVQALFTVGEVFDSITSSNYQGNSTYYKASYQMVTGHLLNDGVGVVTTVKTHWSGSEAGIQDLVSQQSESFLQDGASSSSSTPGPFTTSPVDLCMADNDKAYSKNPGASITGTNVGIVTFKWLKERGSLAGITNLTDANIRVLLTGGTKAALITGNSGDTTWVYVSGRDSFSGTRVNALGTTGYGIFSNPYQVKVAPDGSMIDPDGSQTYVYYDTASLYGYGSGGDLASQMTNDLSQATSVDKVIGSGHFSIVAYLGYSDAATALGYGAGVVELAYNGIMESTPAIQQGLYTFFGNEYLYKKNSGLSSQGGLVYSNLGPAIANHADGTSFLTLASMQAIRNGPTSDPVHK